MGLSLSTELECSMVSPWRLLAARPCASRATRFVLFTVLTLLSASVVRAAEKPTLTLGRNGSYLVIQGAEIPGGDVRINYLEAYCRAGSTDADWVKHTVIRHKCELVSMSADKKTLRLRDTLSDGVVVEHTITAGGDEIDFRLVARNPGTKRSEAHWAQPCVRLGDFTGFDPRGKNIDDYLPKCFVFLEGKLERMPTRTQAA